MSWKPFMPVRLVFVPGMSSSSWVWNGGYQERQGSALRHQQPGRTTSTLQANLCTDFVNISCDKSQKMATPNYYKKGTLTYFDRDWSSHRYPWRLHRRYGGRQGQGLLVRSKPARLTYLASHNQSVRIQHLMQEPRCPKNVTTWHYRGKCLCGSAVLSQSASVYSTIFYYPFWWPIIWPQFSLVSLKIDGYIRMKSP